jgi:hypothetical protein
MQGASRPTRLVQEVTNVVLAFVIVTLKILNAHLGSIREIFVDNDRGKDLKSKFREEKVEWLTGDRSIVVKPLWNYDNIRADVERAGASMSIAISGRCWNGVN